MLIHESTMSRMSIVCLLFIAASWSSLPQLVEGDECLLCRNNPCRLVTGLFTRPTLPVGYNLIARVPAHSCNLTVTELRKSSNYLAIRTEQGYIINGNWALVPPGRYMGAGTGFYYSRPQGNSQAGEVISAPGPFSSNVDIMIIYQSPNHGVKYEYWHPISPPYPPPAIPKPQASPLHKSPHSTQGHRERGHPRHHHHNMRGHHRGAGGYPGSLSNVQPGFVPSAVGPAGTSGGYIGSPGHFPGDYSVSRPSHRPVRPPSGTQGIGHRIHDNSLIGGGDSRNLNPNSVGGVGNMNNIHNAGGAGTGPGIGVGMGHHGSGDPAELSNSLGPSWKVWKFTPCSRTCGGGQQETVYICTGAGGEVLSEEVCIAPKPPPEIVQCNPRPCPPVWQLGEWSQCSASCGTGIMTRTWACVQDVSPTLTRQVPAASCPSPKRNTMVPQSQACNLTPCTRWEVTTWGPCSVDCGTGVMSRHVTCRAEGQRVPDDQCNIQEKPPKKELCHGHSCAHHMWFYTEWSTECIGGCEDGIHTRRVWCSPGANSVEGECDESTRPEETKPCSRADACAAAWFTGPWMPCSLECGNGTTTREVVCVVFLRGTFRATLDIECNPETRPNNTQECNPDPCPPHWYYTDWSQCSRTCGRGTRTRAVQCLDHFQRPSTECSLAKKPPITRTCTNSPCVSPNGISINSSQLSNDGGCVDRFKNCILVQQARLCRYSYYRTVCCASCYHQ